MKTIARLLGGSHLYGLNTKDSDRDVREVFIHEDPEYLYGFKTKDTIRSTEPDDYLAYDLKHFIKLGLKQNLEVLEILHAPDETFEVLEPEFQAIRELRRDFLDSELILKVATGYLKSEQTRAFKRHSTSKHHHLIEKYGFVPKNVVQAIRIRSMVSNFFISGKFEVQVTGCYLDFLRDIKEDPSAYDKAWFENWFSGLDSLFDSRKETLVQTPSKIYEKYAFIVDNQSKP